MIKKIYLCLFLTWIFIGNVCAKNEYEIPDIEVFNESIELTNSTENEKLFFVRDGERIFYEIPFDACKEHDFFDESENNSIATNFKNSLDISHPLISERIKNAVTNIMAINTTLLRVDQLLEISKFIEMNFEDLIKKGIYYLPCKNTSLPCDLEYDPETQRTFIHTEEFVGKGSVKEIVTKSILYDVNQSLMVAKAKTKGGLHVTNEIEIMKKLANVDRTVCLIAAPSHMENNQFVQEIISPLYNGGNLQDTSKKKNLSIKEKVVLALDLMWALKGIHTHNIAHEDIHDANILLEDNVNPNLNKVKYRLVLMDMGKAAFIKNSHEPFARKDIYAAGCTLYGLLHNETYVGLLYNKLSVFSMLLNERGSDHGGLLLGELSPQLTNRKKILNRKNTNQTMNPKEEFEWIILEMLHPTCNDRRDAAHWFDQLVLLFQKLINSPSIIYPFH